jgi:hypothetical protein
VPHCLHRRRRPPTVAAAHMSTHSPHHMWPWTLSHRPLHTARVHPAHEHLHSLASPLPWPRADQLRRTLGRAPAHRTRTVPSAAPRHRHHTVPNLNCLPGLQAVSFPSPSCARTRSPRTRVAWILQTPPAQQRSTPRFRASDLIRRTRDLGPCLATLAHNPPRLRSHRAHAQHGGDLPVLALSP